MVDAQMPFPFAFLDYPVEPLLNRELDPPHAQCPESLNAALQFASREALLWVGERRLFWTSSSQLGNEQFSADMTRTPVGSTVELSAHASFTCF